MTRCKSRSFNATSSHSRAFRMQRICSEAHFAIGITTSHILTWFRINRRFESSPPPLPRGKWGTHRTTPGRIRTCDLRFSGTIPASVVTCTRQRLLASGISGGLLGEFGSEIARLGAGCRALGKPAQSDSVGHRGDGPGGRRRGLKRSLIFPKRVLPGRHRRRRQPMAQRQSRVQSRDRYRGSGPGRLHLAQMQQGFSYREPWCANCEDHGPGHAGGPCDT